MKTTIGLLFAFALLGCTKTVDPIADPAPVAPAEATVSTDLEESGNESEALIIDVRSREEWDSGHLKQAVHIPHTEIAEKIGEHTNDKDQKIILYCAAGGRAGKAQEELQELGFVDVENAGGYEDIKKRFE